MTAVGLDGSRRTTWQPWDFMAAVGLHRRPSSAHLIKLQIEYINSKSINLTTEIGIVTFTADCPMQIVYMRFLKSILLNRLWH